MERSHGDVRNKILQPNPLVNLYIYHCLLLQINEAVYLRNMFKQLLSLDEFCMKIHCDNQGAIFLAKKNAFQARTKQIDIACHVVRDLVGKRCIHILHLGTKLQIADIFT